jgi:outer membrane receptor protein involved in Fe transport
MRCSTSKEGGVMGRVGLLALVAVLIPAVAFAGTVGKIAGRVYDADTGDPLIGANVEVVGTMRGAVAGSDGLFYVVNLDPGTYSVRGSMIGYGAMIVDNVIVMADLTSELQFSLTQAPIEAEEVVVVAERPLIQKDVTASTKITRREQIAAMPVTGFDEVLASGPGTGGQGTNLHVRGGRAGEVVYVVDGIRVDDPQNRQYFLEVGREAIDEMQLVSGGFNAEYGDAQSGVVLVNTREGGADRYSGKIHYKTDDIADDGLADASINQDFTELSLGGPEPISSYALPALGVELPGQLTFFASAESRFSDKLAYHQDALDGAAKFTKVVTEPYDDENGNGRYDEGEDFEDWSGDGQHGSHNFAPWHQGEVELGELGARRDLQTSDEFRNSTWLDDLLGLGGKRENTRNNMDFKLTHQITPSHRLSLGWRRSFRNRHFWHWTQGTDLAAAVEWAQALGIDDGIDNDQDGLVDEEILDGVDNDGDGVVDEYDGHLVDPADVDGGRAYSLGWGVDDDGDGVTDEEALNGLDDDGDGLIDEDLQPYDFNGWDKMHKQQRIGDQYLLSWTHSLSPSTFYEMKLGYFGSTLNWMPKIGKDGVSACTREEIEDWIDEYESARGRLQSYIADDALWDAEREALIRERYPWLTDEELADWLAWDPGARIEYLIDPFRGFGTPPEPFVDVNGNGRYDPDEPGEYYTDLDGDQMWDENNRQNEIWWFEGANHPFRGMVYRGYPGYNTDLNPNYYRSGFSFRDSKTWSAKADITSQVNPHHQVKAGVDLKYYDLYWLSRQLISPYDGRGLFGNVYHVYPWELATYVQDKMEYKSAIVNVGLRFEYFDQGEQIAEADTSATTIPRYGIIVPDGVSREPENKLSLLPRFGISFPVTDRDVFHFFYGHFFQRPRLIDVYYQVNQAIDSANSIVGNPNLDPERTISYEFGLRHQAGLNTVLSVTGFFKDIDRLREIQRVEDEISNVFRTYLNDTYATTKGFELLLTQRMGARFSGEVSYTYQIANTTHSFARQTYGNEELFDILPGTEYPADWDRRHTVNLNMDYRYGEDEGPALGGLRPLENWSVNLLSQVGSGYPYTPTSSQDTPIYEEMNSRRYPWTWNIDVVTRKLFTIAGTRLGLEFEVLNLFDTRNVLGADDALGGAEEFRTIIDAYRSTQPGEDVEDWIGYSNQSPATMFRNYGGYPLRWATPDAWDAGRRIRVGLSLEF